MFFFFLRRWVGRGRSLKWDGQEWAFSWVGHGWLVGRGERVHNGVNGIGFLYGQTSAGYPFSAKTGGRPFRLLGSFSSKFLFSLSIVLSFLKKNQHAS